MAAFDQDISRELAETAQKIARPGKGILAADESTGTIAKRFQDIGVENTEENRAYYRELLLTTRGIGEHISGCILFEETLYQSGPRTKKSMVDLLQEQDIVPGIKVDKGTVDLPGTCGEKATQGLDDLGKRCADYYKAGARFAKWRAVLTINKAKRQPSVLSITETAHTLARYAVICQQNRLVPIVEPEILSDGDHSIEDCARITETVLSTVFRALNHHHVLIEGCLLKPNMVTAGSNASQKASPKDVAFYTVRTLYRTVPPALPGVTFLSGGQSEEEASLNLNAMNQLRKHPFSLTFSFGRALQASTLKAWKGDSKKLEAAQKVFSERCKANGDAQLGKYGGGVGGKEASEGLHVSNYVY